MALPYQNFRLKIVPVPSLRLRFSTGISRAQGQNGISVTNANGVYTIKPGFDSQIAISSISASDRDNLFALIYNSDDETYKRLGMDVLLSMVSGGLDATLVAIAGLSPNANQSIYFTGADAAALYSITASGRALVGLTGASDQLPYFDGAGSAALATFTAFGRTMAALADAAAGRSALGLVIGTNVQAYDAELAALAGLTSAANKVPYFTGSGTAALADLTAYGRSIVAVADEAAFKALVNLEIGTDVQAQDAELAALAGLASAANKLPYFTGSGTADIADFSAYGRSIVAVVDEAAFKALVNLEIGTDVQAQDAELAAIAGLVSAANKLPYFTGSGTASLADFSAYGRSIVAVADEAALKALVNLEIGTDVQGYDAELAAIAGLVSAADKIAYFTGSGTAALADFTAAGRSMAGAANAAAQTALLSNFVGDSGAGGTKGLVPAPAAGDAAASKFLSAVGTWSVPAGAGDVTGPGSSTDNNVVLMNGTTGKVIKDGGFSVSTYAQTILDDANASAARTTLGITGNRLLGVQVFTASGTYTRTSGCTTAVVEVIGGGGGGAGVAAASANQTNVGGGGGGGGKATEFITPGATEAVTIGAAGAGGAAGNNNGNSGGTTSFGAHCSATGGAGGQYSGSTAGSGGTGGAGGVGAGGTYNLSGTRGGWGIGVYNSGLFVVAIGGNGGNAPGHGGGGLGGGPVLSGTSQSAGSAAANDYGAGGGGACATAGVAAAGGDGTPGLVIVWEYE